MGLSDNVIDEIKSRCNIVDVIGRVVSLKKTGSNHKGLCPFHNEKTPSFVVSEDKQIFTCFGCGVTGDVIEFTQRYNNLDFRGAIEKLAGEYGIDLGSNVFPGESQKTQLYEINREAATYFYRCFTERANRGAAYMQSRGLEPGVLRKFGIGYADDGWQSLYDFLKSKGYEDKELLNLGLVAKSKDRIYDKFRDRVMFPIINTRGKVVGFGGRAIGDGMPKYLNSQESLIFQKKNNLFGLNLTRQDINREDCAILVEGYMDVITLYQHGVRNVSASLGTALTENQAAMLKRYTKNIVLAYDGDEAGQSAALRGMDILYAAGGNVKVLQLPDGKDPDEFIRKNGREAFLERIEQALPFMDFKLQHIKKQVDLNTTEGSVTFLKEAARALRLL
ncbi:MAG TPA: DNA primase, partial [Bacillota bacterium]|nr:DNA primase [Bacillota bacterium]